MCIEKSSLCKELKGKETELKELIDVISQIKSNNLDLDKLYDVSRMKSEAVQLREERDELKTRISDVEGAHQLLEGIIFELKINLYINLYYRVNCC